LCAVYKGKGYIDPTNVALLRERERERERSRKIILNVNCEMMKAAQQFKCVIR